MEDKLTILFKNRKEREKKLDEDFKKSSKHKLQKACSTKIRTTMIGALDIIEKHLSKHLEEDSEGAEELQSIYEEIRQEILDKGNTQIRNLEKEFEQYEVTWLRYSMQLPIRHGD
jgi:predicted Co/Zn/Cd cation transporter (cation efflux family)